ncbi:MAG: enoyl-CoA hydratase [Chloroflexota bacterium]
MSNHITTTIKNRVLHIQFNRPDKKNAITGAMYQAIAKALHDADSNDEVRVSLIYGTEGCFTSGNDIQDFLQNPPHSEESPAFDFLQTISHTKKPLVAAVTGIAVGVGTTMLLHCDLVYAAESARFSLPFVNLGLVPEAGSTYILPQMMGHRRAAELLLLGGFFDANEAQEVGIVNSIYPDERLLEAVAEKTSQLAAQPPSALRLTKSLIKQHSQEAVQHAMETEGGHFRDRLQSPEALEAMKAFMERRKPDFSKFT